MQSKAKTVSKYLEEVPPERRPALEKLRSLCREVLAGYEECMEYGMPIYKRDGVAEAGFASQKQYVSIYVLSQEAIAAYRDELKKASLGKGCIRYRKPEHIQFGLLKKILTAARGRPGPVC